MYLVFLDKLFLPPAPPHVYKAIRTSLRHNSLITIQMRLLSRSCDAGLRQRAHGSWGPSPGRIQYASDASIIQYEKSDNHAKILPRKSFHQYVKILARLNKIIISALLAPQAMP